VPSIEEGTLPPALEEEGVRILEEARSHLASEDFEGARDAARNLIRRYPGLEGSGEALEILARAALALGDPAEAREASGRYLALLERSHPSFAGALALNAEALVRSESPHEAFTLLLQMPPDADPDAMGKGMELLREVVGRTEIGRLQEASGALSPRHPMWGILATEVAVSDYLGGDGEEARRLATDALAQGLEPREAALCRGVLDGNLEALLGQPVILGAILPRSGVSPGLVEYAEWVLEGIQVAAEEYQAGSRRPVELEIRDDEGNPDLGGTIVRSLEDTGALGVVGPLTTELLGTVAAGRRNDLPIITPFAALPEGGAGSVFSLSGPDLSGAGALAGYARDLGLDRVVILRPRSEEAGLEGMAFREAFTDLGGGVPREIVYDSGATFFQTQLEEVADLLPDGLFLPLEPRDIEVLAPQFTFFGLDTLGIQILGTGGWTEDEVVLGVDSRHTDGVIASTTRLSQDETEAFARFRQGYETLFQKSLRSQVPAYGYDAAALLLRGLQENPRTPGELLEALSRIQDFPGATGRLSVQGGRILRDPHLVRIQDHEMIYITTRYD